MIRTTTCQRSVGVVPSDQMVRTARMHMRAHLKEGS